MSKHRPTGTDLEPLMDMLAGKDGAARLKAREALVAVGQPAVPSLIRALEDGRLDHLRWEAAKTLGAIGDTTAIPSLVKALEDSDSDVAWLAADALRQFKKAAWPALLGTLIKRGSKSVMLRQGAHHVLRGQREDGFDDLLEGLKNAIESETAPERTPLAAHDILERMRERQETE
jgi:HEAT repeat protein